MFKGGLKVYTTLDTRLQKYAENAVVKRARRARATPTPRSSSIDPRNGYIMAMVGGRDYTKNKFNFATQGKRQPGSSFKTFVLVTALEKGMPPYRYVDSSSPAHIAAKPEAGSSRTARAAARGVITLRAATQHSVNTVFARLIARARRQRRSPRSAQAHGHRVRRPGLSRRSRSAAATSSPLDMASAYGTLATDGVRYPPDRDHQDRRTGRRDLIFEHKPKGKRVLDAASRRTRPRQLLKGVITGGTGTRANIGRPAAGKTGTSQNYRDAWFVGYTPQLVTAVWVGYYKTEKPMRNVHGRRGFGGTLAAPIWATSCAKRSPRRRSSTSSRHRRPSTRGEARGRGARRPRPIRRRRPSRRPKPTARPRPEEPSPSRCRIRCVPPPHARPRPERADAEVPDAVRALQSASRAVSA